jgi:Zn-dependent protease
MTILDTATHLRQPFGTPRKIDPALPPMGVSRRIDGKGSSIGLIVGGVVLCCLLKLCTPNIATVVFRQANLGRLSGFAMLGCALAASIVLHEAGHLSAAILLRFDVLGGALGPWRISRVNRRWKIHFLGGTWFTASVSAIPKKDSSWRRDMLIVIAAGPVATAFCCATATAALLRNNPGGALGCFLAFVAELNSVLFVLGLFPNSSAARAYNDARLFLSLFFQANEAHNILLYQLLIQMKRQGFRPCFYRQDVIRELPYAECGPDMATVFAQAIADWAYDRGDFSTADAWDRRAVEHGLLCEGPFYTNALAHSACLDLMMRCDNSAARSKCADIQFEVLQPEWLRHRTRAVDHLTKGNILEGMCELQRADFLLPNGLPCFEFERELLQCLRQRAKLLSALEVPLPQVP